MNIGQASKASGVSAKMIRYYESIGLIPRSERRQSGYRDYGPADIHRLAFVRRARDLGFSIGEIGELLRLWSDEQRSNAEVKAIALRHVAELQERAKALNEMADALKHLAATCGGDGRSECPIIKGLEGELPIGLRAETRKEPGRIGGRADGARLRGRL
jgi:Cu(I)-responsive transcriptional regulator